MTDLIDLAIQLDKQDFDGIPVIDLNNAKSPSIEARQNVANDIRDACLNAGFFFVKNHGVSKDIVQTTFDCGKAFFAQSDEVKESVDISKSDNFRGYVRLFGENNDPTKKGEMHEGFNMGLDPLLDPHSGKETTSNGQLKHSDNIWPVSSIWNGADQFKKKNLEYYAAVLALGQSLFPLFALALGLEEDFFADKIQHPAAIMRVLQYPGVPEAERDDDRPGIGAHSDFECFTILAQGGPGLQVQNRRGQWIDAPLIPETFVINIGDQFARWTNDVFVSTRHRVLPPVQTRYSIPFFFGCDHDVPLIPPPTCVSKDRPKRYETMTAGQYVHMRLSDIYGAPKTSEE